MICAGGHFCNEYRMDELINMNYIREKHRTAGKLCKWLLAAGVIASAMATLTGCQKQQTDKTKTSTGEVIKVGIDRFEPYSYLDINGEYAGIDIELATKAFEKLGYEPEFQIISWEDKDEYLEDGTIDCIWSCYSMTDREDKYQWAGPYMYSRQVVAVRTDSDIYTLSDLQDKRVAVQATTKAENLFLHIVESPLPDVSQVNSFSSTEEIFAMLRKGYVDAISGHEALISKLTDNGTGAYRMLEDSPYMSEIGVAFAKGTHVELAEKLTETLEEMKEDGTIGEIAEKYGLDPEKTVWGGQTDEN